jgi:hypothetical protein
LRRLETNQSFQPNSSQQPPPLKLAKMGKFSVEDKMRIQTLCEQGLGYRQILVAYPQKQWKLDTVKAICKKFKQTGCAFSRKIGSGNSSM